MRFSQIITSVITTAALALVFSGPAHAAAITASSTNVNIISPPTSIASGAIESDSFFTVFEEQTISITGQNVQTVTIGETNNTGTGGSVTGQVSSFFVHFDQIGEGDDVVELTGGFLEFDRDIVGIIWGASDIGATDATLGLAGTTYTPAPFRGYESLDSLIFTASNRVDFSARVSNKKIDSFRVLLATTEVPEPGAIAILGFGIAVLGFARRRRIV